MNIQEIQRRAGRMSAHVNWLKQQKSGPVAPKVAAPVVPAAPVVNVEAPAEPVVPVETVAAPEEPTPAPEAPVDQRPTWSSEDLKKMDQEELLKAWDAFKGDANVEKEIFRRSRKWAKKNKLELPEGECSGDNVQKFIDVLLAPAKAE